MEDSSTDYETKYPIRSRMKDVREIRSRAERALALALDLSDECTYPWRHTVEHHYAELDLPGGLCYLALWELVAEVVIGDIEDWLDQGWRSQMSLDLSRLKGTIKPRPKDGEDGGA